jgi:hypothetical protein
VTSGEGDLCIFYRSPSCIDLTGTVTNVGGGSFAASLASVSQGSSSGHALMKYITLTAALAHQENLPGATNHGSYFTFRFI